MSFETREANSEEMKKNIKIVKSMTCIKSNKRKDKKTLLFSIK